MSRLPIISGRKCVKTLVKAGFYFRRQEGSHIILRRDDSFAQITVPEHRELHRGTLRAIIRQAELTVEEFLKLL